MTTNVNNNARTSATPQIERDAGTSNSASAEVKDWVAGSYQIEIERKGIAKLQAEVAEMKSALTEKRQEIELLREQVYSGPPPATPEAADLRYASAVRLRDLAQEVENLKKGIDGRTQTIIAAQATVLTGLSNDATAMQEINNTRGEIRSMQAEYDILAKNAGAIMEEGTRTGKLGHRQELKLQEALDQLNFLRNSIDARSGHVVVALNDLIDNREKDIRAAEAQLVALK